MAELNSLADLGTVAAVGRSRPRRSTSRSSTPRAAPMPPASARTPIARVWIKPGNGKITVNGKEFEAYFARPVLQMILQQPIVAATAHGQYDVVATVAGGGLSGQAGAVRHGISKALTYLRAGPAPGAQEGRLPDPRQPRRRAQEVRQGQGPPFVPVLEALIFFGASRISLRRAVRCAALFRCGKDGSGLDQPFDTIFFHHLQFCLGAVRLEDCVALVIAADET